MFVSLPANVDVVDVRGFLGLRSNGNWRGDGRLGHLLHLHAPLILWLLQIAEPELWLPVGDHQIDSVFAQNPMDFRNHLVRSGSWILATLLNKINTSTESRVALSTTASNEDSGKSIALTSMSRYLKLSPFWPYFYFIALMQTLETSMLDMLV